MSKRRRDGAILVTHHRPIHRPTTPEVLITKSSSSSSSTSISHFFSPQVSRKRPYEGECETTRKRQLTSITHKETQRGQKRSADFDFEIERLQKRLKATTPSAKEAICFLLPHLLEMRRLYLNERQNVFELQKDNNNLKRNNTIITQTLRDQLTKKNIVQRQLDMKLYRLSLMRDGNSF